LEPSLTLRVPRGLPYRMLCTPAAPHFVCPCVHMTTCT
jgi:hypothetical protein